MVTAKELLAQAKDIKKYLSLTVSKEDLEEKDTDTFLIKLLKRGHKYTEKKLTEEEKRFVLLANQVLDLGIAEEEFSHLSQADKQKFYDRIVDL